MPQLLGSWLFKVGDLEADRVDPGKDMSDHAILARGVHRLKDAQDALVATGVHLLLCFPNMLEVLLNLFFNLLQLGSRILNKGRCLLNLKIVSPIPVLFCVHC